MDAHTGTMLLYSKEVLAKELGKKRKIGKKELVGKIVTSVWELTEKPEYEICFGYSSKGKDKKEYEILGITKEEMLDLCWKFSEVYKKFLEK